MGFFDLPLFRVLESEKRIIFLSGPDRLSESIHLVFKVSLISVVIQGIFYFLPPPCVSVLLLALLS